MENEDLDSILTYHEATKHSEVSTGASGHFLDWDNKPSQFKEYQNLPSVALPRVFPHPVEKAVKAVRDELVNREVSPLDLSVLAELLFFSAGLTRKMRFGREVHYMRAASATGALYPIELYVISGRIRGLEAGVYHFNPLHFSLTRLRDGDYRGVLGEAGGIESLHAPLTLAFTSLAWRNSWKYEARSYRHWFWDSGVIVANLLATANAAGLVAKVEVGFVDSAIDNLLGLEKRKEATVALTAVGQIWDEESRDVRGPISPLDLKVDPISKTEVEYPIIWEANEVSGLRTEGEADSWRKKIRSFPRSVPSTNLTFRLKDLEDDLSPPLDKVVLLRGSTRRFAREPIPFEALSTILKASASPIPFDFLAAKQTLIDFYFIANDVEGLPSGAYFYNPDSNSVEQLKSFKNRYMSGYLCLGQQLFSEAGAVFFLMTDLQSVLGSLGSRGYRAAQFEAGIRAGKIYLSAYSQGIGASGSTFFDDAVTEFFSPHAKGKSPMIAVGAGNPAYKARPGKVLPQMTTKVQAA